MKYQFIVILHSVLSLWMATFNPVDELGEGWPFARRSKPVHDSQHIRCEFHNQGDNVKNNITTHL